MTSPSPRVSLSGLGFGLAAYATWGFFPLFFRQLAGVPPIEVLCNRAAWGFLFISLLLGLRRQWGPARAALAHPAHRRRLALAALLVGSNWLVFLHAVDSRQVVASSLGYFLTPLVSVLLGLIVLKERLNRLEWGSVALAVIAVINEISSLGHLPWISLVLAATFGCYGLVRKQVPVDALSGLWLETLVMLPLCLAYTLWAGWNGQWLFVSQAPLMQAGLILAGVITALPLLAFAAATRRLDLATVGMLMYINPSLQFLTAVAVFHEPLRPGQALTFSLIGGGLALFTFSTWKKTRV